MAVGLRRRSATTPRWAATRASGIRCCSPSSTPARPSCCRSSIGLSLALLVLQIPRGQGAAAHRRDPADRARAGGGRPVLAHAGAGARLRPRRSGDARARARQPQLARRPAAGADLGDRHPHLAVDAVRLPGAAGDARDAAARRLRGRAPRPRRRLAALPPHHAAADPAGHRHGASSCA